MIIDFFGGVVCPHCIKFSNLEDFLKDNGRVRCKECKNSFFIYEMEHKNTKPHAAPIYKSSTTELCGKHLEIINILSFHDIFGRT